ncbi:DUF7669 domain-containing protein [Actinophytocola sp.]|uniref:DUF7669 domain-containing protein n=1 Tax=Actinophytocola sp. TaxID=1872138 RepID=UPI002D326128|nr:hypothetical protein [Actinophytocola sp.]HYQ67502.1 hypothetical protein [Actinophytocola sp.]
MTRWPGRADEDGFGSDVRVWLSRAVWAVVAIEVREYRKRGFGALLTKDAVRFCAARALVDAGVEVASLRVEAAHPVLKGARVDLVVGGDRPVASIELQYPREPNPANAAWTTALGEVLKDFYRLAVYPGAVDRLFVFVETAQLRRYMAGVVARYGVDLDADTVILRPGRVAALPSTATTIIGTQLAAHHVTAQRLALLPVDDALRLAVYRVDPVAPQPDDVTEPLPPERSTRDGARREILDAIRAVLTRSGGDTFTPVEIVAEMTRRETGYAESTIRTMITGHLCWNAPDNAGTTYDDLERIDRGRYRLRTT